MRRLAPLLGVTMLVHQGGSFLGVWLGGVAVARTGSYDALWIVDAALAVVAALVHLPLREPTPSTSPALPAIPVRAGMARSA